LSIAKILVVDDDPQIRRVMKATLVGHSYEVLEARTGEEALERLPHEMPNLVLLDMNMPGIGGLETCRAICAGSDIPVIILSVRNTEKDKVAALDAGADDYVTKPFSAPELLARIRAVLRRRVRVGNVPASVQIGTITVDLSGRSARGPEGLIHLTPLEYRVLECLVGRAGMIVTQEQLIRDVWGPDRTNDTRRLRSYIKFLRQKLEPDPSRPRYLVTETGVGYRLRLDDAVMEQ
jgi:two-component system, OmpR family, KDP operon response regulator KdpE